MKIELHMFTNCTKYMPSTKMIRDTYKSFCQTFGDMLVSCVWCDPKPYPNKYKSYVRNLHKNFKNVVQTSSLSDGYIKAIKTSDADYLFMLEHDWIFETELVKHKLSKIVEVMQKSGIYHLRFNKHANYPTKRFDSVLKEYNCDGMDFCTTPFLSNNPHIINKKVYMQFVRYKMVKTLSGPDGIEEIISKYKSTWGALYGGLDYPTVIKHLDGRGERKR